MATHNKEIDKIITSVSSFYSDNTYNSDVLNTIYKAYFNLMDAFKYMVVESGQSALLSHMNGYRTTPMQTIDAWSGIYDVNKAAARFTADGYGNWYDDTNPDLLKNKVAFLTKYGVYETISTRRDWEVVNSPIASLEIVSGFGDNAYSYANFKDYVIKGNNLYLFEDLAKPSVTTYGKKILLKNIKVSLNPNRNPLVNQVSSIQSSPYLTMEENAKLSQSLMRAVSGGPTVANLNEALAILYSAGNLKVVDEYSASPSDKGMWLGPTPALKPFDFMIKIPQSYALFTDTVDLIQNYINVVKPSYTNYMIIWAQGTKDILPSGNDIVTVKLPILSPQQLLTPSDVVSAGKFKMPDIEVISPSEVYNVTNVLRRVDSTSPSDAATMLKLTANLTTDTITSDVALFDTGLLFDTGVIWDATQSRTLVALTTIPEMPVAFSLQAWPNNVIVLQFNNTYADYYEVLRDGAYTIITTPSEAVGTTVNVLDNTDNSLALGSHTYKVRAWQAGKSSQWSLPFSGTIGTQSLPSSILLLI